MNIKEIKTKRAERAKHAPEKRSTTRKDFTKGPTKKKRAGNALFALSLNSKCAKIAKKRAGLSREKMMRECEAFIFGKISNF